MDRQIELMLGNGYDETDGIIYLTDDYYTEALIGITHDMRTVYDYGNQAPIIYYPLERW